MLMAGSAAGICQSADCPDLPPPECETEIAAGRWNLLPVTGTIRITGTETDRGPAVEEGHDPAIDWTVDGTLAHEWIGGEEENYVDIDCDGTVTGKGHDRITGEIRKTMVEETYCNGDSDGILGENPVETHTVTLERTYDIVGRVLDAGTMELTFDFTSGNLEMTADLGDWFDCIGIKGVFVAQATVPLDGESETLEVTGIFDPSEPVLVTLQPRDSEDLWLHQFLSKHLYEIFISTGHPFQWNSGIPERYGPFLQLEGPEVEWTNGPQMQNVSPLILAMEAQSPKFYIEGVTAQNQIVASIDWRNAPEPHEVEFDYDGEKITVLANGDRAEVTLDMGRPGVAVTAVAKAGEFRSPPYPLALYKVPVPGWAAPASAFTAAPGIQYETTLDWPITLETTRTLDTISIFTGLWGIKGSARSELRSASLSSGAAMAGDLKTEVTLKLANRNFSLTMEGPNTSILDCETIELDGEATVHLPPAEWEATLNPLTLLPGLQPALSTVPGVFGNALRGVVNGFGLKTSASVALSGTAGYEGRESDIRWVSGSLNGTIKGSVGIVVIPPPIDKVLSASIEANATGCLGFDVAPEFLLNQLGGSVEVNGHFAIFGMNIFSGSEEWPFGDPCGPTPLSWRPASLEDPMATPSELFLAMALRPDGWAAAAWSEIPEGQARPSGDIVIQFFDGQTWREPLRITDDVPSDLSPAVAFDEQGMLVVCYQRNPAELLPADVNELQAFAQGLEIAYALVDPATGLVQDAGLLTQDNAFDFGPTLRTDSTGAVHLFWQRTDGESTLGTDDHPASILTRVWVGGEWLDETVAAANLTGVFGWHPAAYSPTEAVIGIVRDMDGDLADASDQEIHLARMLGGVWQPVVQLTDNAVEDSGVLAGFDAEGNAALAWRQSSTVVGLHGDLTAEPQVWFPADIEVGPGFALGRMFAGDQGIGMIWPEANNLYLSATFGGTALPDSDWRAPEVVAQTTGIDLSFDAMFVDGELFRYAAARYDLDDPSRGVALDVESRSILPLFPNQAPLAGPDRVLLLPGQSVLIPFEDLLSNDRDPDGNPLQLLWVDSTSLRGVVLSLDADTILYTASLSDEPDSFAYGIGDGRGGYAEALVTVEVIHPPVGPAEFMITRVSLDPEGQVRLEVPTDTESYFVLYRGLQIDAIDEPIAIFIGDGTSVETVDPTSALGSASQFYRAQKIPLTAPQDHDGDGLDDLVELAHPAILDPLNPADANEDPDGDGVPNWEEIARGTNPLSSDTDGDGIDDRYELDRPSILDPLDPTDAGEDPDGDGLTNLEEYDADRTRRFRSPRRP
jgi:hypothetical protein